MLEAGMKAPDFTLEDKDGNLVSLHDFAGKKVVVYFYPKDSTPGCTRQACAFRNNYGEYKNLGVEVIGISKDSVKIAQQFCSQTGTAFYFVKRPGA